MSQDKQSAIEAAAKQFEYPLSSVGNPVELSRGIVLAYLNALVEDEGTRRALATVWENYAQDQPVGYGFENEVSEILRTLATRAQGEKP
jgi:hypothetical protein